MERKAILAMEHCKELKRIAIEEHKRSHADERQCRGLSDVEWFKFSIKQKTTFSKSKKFSVTKLWNHNHVTL